MSVMTMPKPEKIAPATKYGGRRGVWQAGLSGGAEGEDERADDGEDRHRFGEAIDRRAPLLTEQEKNGADERSGVADADPPDEVRDVPGPVDRRVVTPDADARVEEVSDREAEDARAA